MKPEIDRNLVSQASLRSDEEFDETKYVAKKMEGSTKYPIPGVKELRKTFDLRQVEMEDKIVMSLAKDSK